jgi:hypothetical protein
LSGDLDKSFDVNVYDIDLFDNTASDVRALHDDGRYVICYISAGSREDWRDDASDFPSSVVGRNLDGWPGEKWLDISQLEIVMPVMRARIDLANAKGCDAIEPDNTDAYQANSGFQISKNDEIAYFSALSDYVHSLGMAIALKNSLELIPSVIAVADFAINEECMQYSECDSLNDFINAEKPVFHCEYSARFDPCNGPNGFSSIRKSLDLTARPLIECLSTPVLEEEVGPPFHEEVECQPCDCNCGLPIPVVSIVDCGSNLCLHAVCE